MEICSQKFSSKTFNKYGAHQSPPFLLIFARQIFEILYSCSLLKEEMTLFGHSLKVEFAIQISIIAGFVSALITPPQHCESFQYIKLMSMVSLLIDGPEIEQCCFSYENTIQMICKVKKHEFWLNMLLITVVK
jgi:hypothetical protein